MNALAHQVGSFIDAVNPPETEFGFLYFAHMVPPIKPEHTLMLGYGQGVVADLMRKIWGLGCKITAVDMKGYQKPGCFEEYQMIVGDAKSYVWDSTNSVIKRRFDYIAVDLFEDDQVCDFIYDVEFAVRLREMARNLVCINQPKDDFMKLKHFYDYGFQYERFVDVYENRVSWWSVANKE